MVEKGNIWRRNEVAGKVMALVLVMVILMCSWSLGGTPQRHLEP